MKIVLDENIIYADEFFGKTAIANRSDNQHTLIKKAGREITHADLVDADALLVRSVTQVNEALLHNTAVKFVGTATIGTDHIDLAYLKKHNIQFADASGCSKDTVAQYVITAIHALRPKFFTHSQLTPKLGIIGFGNIGKSLAKISEKLGWSVLAHDPFETIVQTEHIHATSLTHILQQADVISLHVPLTHANQSSHPTHHLINKDTLAQIPADSLLINSARGKVICEADLLADIQTTKRDVVLDVFEHEPYLSLALINSVTIATPHIAGYSVEGKARGTQYIYNAFCEWLTIPNSLDFQQFLSPAPQVFPQNSPNMVNLANKLSSLYPIKEDAKLLRDTVTKAHAQKLSKSEMKQQFDILRKEYSLRREWQAYGLPTFSQS